MANCNKQNPLQDNSQVNLQVNLQVMAANAILPYMIYQPPEILRGLWNDLARPPVEWSPLVQHWLRQADSNFWNKYLPPLPDNQ